MHPVEEIVANFLTKYELEGQEPYLVGVSGGADSMSLLHALYRLKKRFLVVHVNYNLRGKDSIKDEQFVTKICKSYKIKYRVFNVDTVEKLGSVQLWARNVRYGHFRTVSKELGGAPIFTAHHAGDQTETILFNLIGGTGIKGITGIKASQNGIYRPFLNLKKEILYKYLEQIKAEYREDATNQQNTYSRNRIRNSILPELEKINPAAQDNIIKTANNLHATGRLAKMALQNIKRDLFEIMGATCSIKINKLEKLNPDVHVLFLLLKDFSVNIDICTNLLQVIGNNEPKTFLTSSHLIIVQRKHIYISPKRDKEPEVSVFEDVRSWANHPHFQVRESVKINKNFSNSAVEEYFDIKSLRFPITYRPWMAGDNIEFGKNGQHQKVAAILSDKKIPYAFKKMVYVLEDGNQSILWICGIKRAAIAQVNSTTNTALFVKLLK